MPSNLEVGSRFEVKESGVWYPARVLKEEEDKVWIHFEGWSQRFDRWLPKDSDNIRGPRHKMRRRSRAEDEKPSKKTATLKVGGVFHANSRRSRRSIEQALPKESPAKTPSIKTKEAPKTPEVTTKDTTNVKPQVVQTSSPPIPATPTKGTPVGWAYEVVTDPKDLLPKKAFQINEDHNEFKCSDASCGKTFRKEKLLQSHMKHYHGISSSEETNNEALTNSPPPKRRRSRKSKSEVDELSAEDRDKQLHIETENSSSTDISSATIIDNGDAVVPTKEIPKEQKTSHSDDKPQIDTNGTPVITAADADSASAAVTPGASVPRTPVFGRVGQNRYVPIPEPLVLGREKRRVMKTERMQEAEGSLMKRQPKAPETPLAEKTPTPKTFTPPEREKKRKSISSGDKERTRNDSFVQETFVEPPMDVTPSDDETICSPSVLSPNSHLKLAQENIERDMVHCYCGVPEESGLMMQCDLCLCWQHGSCFGLENEQLVPEKYICIACQNARRVLQRRNQKIASYKAMAEGKLPGLTPGEGATPQRFVNLTQIASVMANLQLALRGLEKRVRRIMNDKEKPMDERKQQLSKAIEDTENVQRQMDTCERILSAIDRPTGDQGNEAIILKSTVKSVLKDLSTAQRLTLFR